MKLGFAMVLALAVASCGPKVVPLDNPSQALRFERTVLLQHRLVNTWQINAGTILVNDRVSAYGTTTAASRCSTTVPSAFA